MTQPLNQAESPRREDDLNRRLRTEARRHAPAFDPALHARVMAAVGAADASTRLSRPPRRLYATWRYALAATLLLAGGLVAVVGSGWLRDHVHRREARRAALASLSTWPVSAVQTPGRALDSVEALVGDPWRQFDADLCHKLDSLRRQWMVRYLWPAAAAPVPEPRGDDV